MATTITTTTGAISPTHFNNQRKLDRCANGNLWAMIHNVSQSRLEFWVSTDDGASWTEESDQRIDNIEDDAAGSMRIATRADGAERLGVVYVRSSHVRGNLGKFNDARTGFSWQQSNLILSTAGSSDFWSYPDLELVPLGSSWVMPVAWSRLIANKTYLWWTRVRWPESGNGIVLRATILHERVSTIHTRPSLAVRHLGDDETVYTASPDLYIAWATGAPGDNQPRQYMMRMTSRGLTWDRGIVRVMREAGVLAGEKTAAAFTGKAFVAVRAPYDDGTEDPETLQLHIMDPPDAIRETIDVPALGSGDIANVGLSWDNYSGDVYILANGDANQNPKYIRYLWATRQFDASWTTVNADGANGNSFSLKPGSRHTRVEMLYSIVSGADRAARYELVDTTNTLPSMPTWVTPTGAKNRSASLDLEWAHQDVDGDAQSAYTLERRLNAGAAEYWNGATWQSVLVNITSATQSVTLSSGWAAAGDSLEFRVRTADAVDFGPFSAVLPILATTIVNPSITSPANGANLNSTPVTLTWTADEQSAFRVRLLESSLEVYDSDWVGEPETRAFEIPYVLEDGASYTIELTTQNLVGFESAAQSVTVTVSLAPPPTPIVTLTAIPADGAIDVAIDNEAPTAFPAVGAIGTGHTSTSSGTSKLVNCPTHNADDRLVLIMCWDGTAAISSVSAVDGDVWVERFNGLAASSAARLAVYEIVKRSTGASSQDVTVTLGTASIGAASILRITGSHNSQGLVASTNATGTSTAPNPTAATLTDATAEDTLWIAACGYDDGTVTVSGYPANYASNQTNVRANVSTGAGIGYATRELNAASEDPGAFTISGSQEWAAVTLGILAESYADNNDIYRTGPDAIETLIARFVEADTTFRDYGVAHDLEYTYRVVARSSSGATTST